ncbi:Uncharacterised protein [Serratia fonticola]|uniref:hypothetical protein n=1 Tax=Serratia fonticola TaxID=47917 RepID=UPI002183CA7E|nr:hypothetical protein [Serratia fonticola]CAI2078276.1 Uncharacterised protein [Serratia fonticola]
MSLFRHIATATGIIGTLFTAYQAQKAATDTMKANAFSSGNIRAGRVGALFITTLVIGGLADALIKRTFS